MAIEESGWSPSRPQLKTDMEKIRQTWIGFCEGKDVSEWNRNAVMITISAAAYDFYLRLLTKCQQEISDGESENSIEECVKEEDSVYYRFCGAALSSMLHSRYEKRVDCIKPDKKDCIQREIVVLRAKVISQVS